MTNPYWSPRVDRASGPISAGTLTEMVESSDWVRKNGATLRPPVRSGIIIDTWFGLIVSATALGVSGRRWTYTVSHVDLTSTPTANPNTVASLDAAVWQQGSGTVLARNLYEWQTAITGELGDGSDPALIPAGFAFVAVRGVVLVHTTRCYLRVGTAAPSEVVHVNIFERANGISGECV